jgi:hypothetical protein
MRQAGKLTGAQHQHAQLQSVPSISIEFLAQLLEDFSLVVGVFLSDLPGLVGARRLVFPSSSGGGFFSFMPICLVVKTAPA